MATSRSRALTARIVAWCALAILVAACAPQSRPDGAAPAQSAPAAQPNRRPLVIAINREPSILETSMLPQPRDEAGLLTGFLALIDGRQQPHPYLAAELPTVQAGTWKVLPDGRMETTYKLRPNATWHDGAPLTAEDFVFAHRVRLDPDFPGFSTSMEYRVSRAVALDPHTLLLEWKEPYLWAGMLHLPNFSPMPRHRVEQLYGENREAFLTGTHWRDQFVHAGPYRVARWEPGVELVLEAFPAFVLGAPALQQVIIRFMPDPNTVVANLMGGTVDMSWSATIGFQQAQALEQSGWRGRVEYWSGNPRIVQFQARDWPGVQRAVLDARVRRALLHGIDRRSMVDAVFAGKGRVAHFWLHPTDPAYPAVDRAVAKYDYDPTRAEALLREAGWTRGSDGVARNAAGEPLTVPINNQPGDQEAQEGTILVDNWKQIGVPAEIKRVTPQELRDGEMRSKYPAVAYERRNLALDNMVWTISEISRPENRWSGSNRNGWASQAFDDLWRRVLGTIDPTEREGLLVQALGIMQDEAYVTLTHLQAAITAYDSALTGPAEPSSVGNAQTWNAYQWRWAS